MHVHVLYVMYAKCYNGHKAYNAAIHRHYIIYENTEHMYISAIKNDGCVFRYLSAIWQEAIGFYDLIQNGQPWGQNIKWYWVFYQECPKTSLVSLTMDK